MYFVIHYRNFLLNGTLVTNTKQCHLYWPWNTYFDGILYTLFLSINTLYLFRPNYSIILLILIYMSLLISSTYFKYNVGELWCFYSVIIPILILGISYLI